MRRSHRFQDSRCRKCRRPVPSTSRRCERCATPLDARVIAAILACDSAARRQDPDTAITSAEGRRYRRLMRLLWRLPGKLSPDASRLAETGKTLGAPRTFAHVRRTVPVEGTCQVCRVSPCPQGVQFTLPRLGRVVTCRAHADRAGAIVRDLLQAKYPQTTWRLTLGGGHA